jgi:hypothetical protein
MSPKIFFLLAGAILLFAETASCQTHKEAEVKDILVGLNLLSKMASEREASHTDEANLSQAQQKSIKKTFRKMGADNLARMAIICDTLFDPGAAEDQRYDEVYYQAFWICVDILEDSQTQENLDALLRVEWHARLDGGERELFDESMESFKKALKEKRSGGPASSRK